MDTFCEVCEFDTLDTNENACACICDSCADTADETPEDWRTIDTTPERCAS